MGWRIRRWISLGGGIRASLSRRGVGWSWGIPGFRIGRGADGAGWVSIGIPGTGIYFTKRFSLAVSRGQPSDSEAGPADARTEDPVASSSRGVKEWRELK